MVNSVLVGGEVVGIECRKLKLWLKNDTIIVAVSYANCFHKFVNEIKLGEKIRVVGLLVICDGELCVQVEHLSKVED